MCRADLKAWHLSKAAQLLPGSVLQPVSGRVGDGARITQASSQQEGPVLRVHKALQAWHTTLDTASQLQLAPGTASDQAAKADRVTQGSARGHMLST